MDPVRSPQLIIPVVLGSVRPNRRSLRAAELLVERLRHAGHQTELIDLRELDLPMYGMEDHGNDHPQIESIRASITASHASVWLSPEYNHSFTSAIKNAIDFISHQIHRKPVAICGLAGGQLGGARGVEQLKSVMIELHAVPIRDSVYFSDAGTIFDAEGNLTRPEYIRRIDQVIAELTWYARALAWGRMHVPIPERVR